MLTGENPKYTFGCIIVTAATVTQKAGRDVSGEKIIQAFPVGDALHFNI